MASFVHLVRHFPNYFPGRNGNGNQQGNESSNDPADWNAASYNAHPVDDIEPQRISYSEFREACIELLHVLAAIDTHMKKPRDARLAWIQVSLALGLDSTRGRTETEIAKELKISKQALSRGIPKFLRMTGLEPAFGLKSQSARRKYQTCH